MSTAAMRGGLGWEGDGGNRGWIRPKVCVGLRPLARPTVHNVFGNILVCARGTIGAAVVAVLVLGGCDGDGILCIGWWGGRVDGVPMWFAIFSLSSILPARGAYTFLGPGFRRRSSFSTKLT